MSKKVYKFSEETLAYVEVYSNNKQKLISYSPIFLFGFITCILILLLGSAFIKSPVEKKLIEEKYALEMDYENLEVKLRNVENRLTYLNTRDDSLYRTVLGAEPIPKSIRDAGMGGSSFINSKNENKTELANKVSKDIASLLSKMKVLDNSMNQVYEFAKKNKDRMIHLPAIMPIYNKDLKGTGAGFGMRWHPILGIRRMHEGIDFYASKGTEVFATADGVVKKAYLSKTFGNVIIVDHKFGVETYYAHLSKFNIKSGQNVKRGDTIGFVGSTGLSSGPHLHYEVHIEGKEVDPVHYFYADLTPEQYKHILRLVEKNQTSMD
jgi:murein DD-endopeptidase MepM/ murein hydrolase activator NlpD